MPIIQVREITFDPSDSELVTFKRDFAADQEPACFLKKKKKKRFQEFVHKIWIKTYTQWKNCSKYKEERRCKINVRQKMDTRKISGLLCGHIKFLI